MVLSKNELKKLCGDNKLIVPFLYDHIQTSSYDLTLGDEYYLCDSDQKKIVKLGKNESLTIPKDAICYVISDETVNMPNNLTATASLDFSLVKSGVVLCNQPPIDAGYNGKIVALLHNLSNCDVVRKRGEHILSIMFYELSSSLDEEDLYRGSYQNLDSLTSYCKNVTTGGIQAIVNEMKEKFDNERMKFTQFLPTIITLITTLLTFITIILGIITIKTLFK